MPKYIVNTPLKGVDVAVGKKVELTEKEAAPLLACCALTDPAVLAAQESEEATAVKLAADDLAAAAAQQEAAEAEAAAAAQQEAAEAAAAAEAEAEAAKAADDKVTPIKKGDK